MVMSDVNGILNHAGKGLDGGTTTVAGTATIEDVGIIACDGSSTEQVIASCHTLSLLMC
jgi:hypothetical protein